MSKKWMPIATGTLNILSGVSGAYYCMTFVLSHKSWVVVIILPLAATAIYAIRGGVYALKKREWRRALIGSISAVFTLLILGWGYYIETKEMIYWIPSLVGIAAIVLTVLSRKEFK